MLTPSEDITTADQPDVVVDNLKAYLNSLAAGLEAMRRAARSKVVGRRVRIISTRYNGQPYGRSRKALTGKECVISSVGDGLNYVFIESEREALHLEDFEFIEPTND